jgi:hypothetical protein
MSLPRAFTALSGATAVSMLAELVRGKVAARSVGQFVPSSEKSADARI